MYSGDFFGEIGILNIEGASNKFILNFIVEFRQQKN